MSDVYVKQYDRVVEQAENLTQGIVTEEWQDRIDFGKGGYKRSPKFPLPSGWEFLLQCHDLTDNKEALEAFSINACSYLMS